MSGCMSDKRLAAIVEESRRVVQWDGLCAELLEALLAERSVKENLASKCASMEKQILRRLERGGWRAWLEAAEEEVNNGTT